MAFYANDSAVRQIDAGLFDEWIAAGNPKADGWTLIADPPSELHSWDGLQWILPPPDTRPAIVTAQQFRDRFTDGELVGMLSSTDVGVKLLVLKVQTAEPFPMDRPSVQQGLDYLVSKGIITEQRRGVIGALT